MDELTPGTDPPREPPEKPSDVARSPATESVKRDEGRSLWMDRGDNSSVSPTEEHSSQLADPVVASSTVERDDLKNVQTGTRPVSVQKPEAIRGDRSNTNGERGALRRILIVAISLLILYGIAAWQLIWRLPSEARVFACLLTVSLSLIIVGLMTMIFIIPAAGPDYEVKTEFYSVRAAYFCVLAGLTLVVIASFGMILWGLHVFSAR